MKNLVLCLLLSGSAFAGEKTAATVETASPWSGSLAAGWDSLYMFRGVNQLPGPGGYGSGISWTALSMAWSPTEQDSFAASTWVAFGTNQTDYKEVDVTFSYTRSLGDLSLSAGYALYAVLSEPGGLYSNEIYVSAAYEFRFGAITFTPTLNYTFTLGPPPGGGGYIDPGASYLELRIDAEIPLYRNVVSATPWVASGFNFGYNSTDADVPETFDGADHLEMGLALPIALTSSITLSPYVAYSHTWLPLLGTRRDTFWGGASITFSF